MTDYTELVKALRCCTQNPPETCVGCTYNIGNNECAVRGMMCDAAAAIEELKAIAHSHCVAASAYWEELEELKAQLPKRGEWITIRLNNGGSYTGCSCCEAPIPTDTMLDYIPESESKYCYSCGAKMEVQDA